jgi:hypothetical protein
MKTLILVLFSFNLFAQPSLWQVEQDTITYPVWYNEIGTIDTISVTMLVSIEDVVRVISGYKVREISGHNRAWDYELGVIYHRQYKHIDYLNAVKERLDMEEIKNCGLNFIIWQVKQD